jgi:hypothetical protein
LLWHETFVFFFTYKKLQVQVSHIEGKKDGKAKRLPWHSKQAHLHEGVLSLPGGQLSGELRSTNQERNETGKYPA